MIAAAHKQDKEALSQWRCAACNNRLADLRLSKGSTIVIKCDRCGHFNRLQQS